MMKRLYGWLAAFLLILALPFLLKPPAESNPAGARRLVAVSPHNEATRYEFENAFRGWYRQRYGETADIEWRNLGGTSEIVRFIDSEFEAAGRVGREGIGIDVFFGGGSFDHARQARKGHLQPCAIRTRHPEWLNPEIMPQQFSGETLHDSEDLWYGCCLSGFGICYNEDLVRSLGTAAPERWEDLARPEFFGRIALADPSKSGSINKAFETLIQEQMAASAARAGLDPGRAGAEELAEGWRTALNLLKRIGANCRYFTDSASKVPLDVAQGNAAAGMCIDFYGRFQSETVEREEGSKRMRYFTPTGGSSFSADPVGILRGAPDAELARRFVEFLLSPEGQRLWNYRIGTPGGPVKYSLRRLPIRKDAYGEAGRPYRSDPDVNPYLQAGSFVYRPGWTGPMFGLIRLLVRAMCIDTHPELVAAGRAIQAAGGPSACPEAMARLEQLPANAEYPAALRETTAALGEKKNEIAITREWTVFFRENYRQAETLARAAADRRRP
ncbi:MAG TPA: extracellular solute-binding protein [bacterium]|nr:extracellular solute-binding protein [bacterium]